MVRKSKCEKIRKEANLGPHNLWKAVRIAHEKSHSSNLEEMQDSSGQKLKSNQEKVVEKVKIEKMSTMERRKF